MMGPERDMEVGRWYPPNSFFVLTIVTETKVLVYGDELVNRWH